MTHEGDRIEDPEILDRIRSLAIPPAWTEVWICPDPRGHIQATGFDDAGRKQYRYHDDWRRHRDRRKFDLMLEFGAKLPALREAIHERLGARGLGFERIAACSVALLDLGLFRVGNTRYEDEHGTYGLTTLKVRHVAVASGVATFTYRAKSGQRIHHQLSDPDVVRTIRSLIRRKGATRGANLFGFREGRDWRDLTSDQVNSWIADQIGEHFSAKDFRTWNATVLAAAELAARSGNGPGTQGAKRRVVKEVAVAVSERLHNTAAVTRTSYIDPRVFDRFNSGQTVAPALARLDGAEESAPANRAAIERAVRRLLAD